MVQAPHRTEKPAGRIGPQVPRKPSRPRPITIDTAERGRGSPPSRASYRRLSGGSRTVGGGRACRSSADRRTQRPSGAGRAVPGRRAEHRPPAEGALRRPERRRAAGHVHRCARLGHRTVPGGAEPPVPVPARRRLARRDRRAAAALRLLALGGDRRHPRPGDPRHPRRQHLGSEPDSALRASEQRRRDILARPVEPAGRPRRDPELPLQRSRHHRDGAGGPRRRRAAGTDRARRGP